MRRALSLLALLALAGTATAQVGNSAERGARTVIRGDILCGNNNGCDIDSFADITADDIVTTTADFTTAKIKTINPRDNALGTGYDLDGVTISTTVDGEVGYSPPITLSVVSGGAMVLHDGNSPDYSFDGVTVESTLSVTGDLGVTGTATVDGFRLTPASSPKSTSSTPSGEMWMTDGSPGGTQSANTLYVFDGTAWQAAW